MDSSSEQNPQEEALGSLPRSAARLGAVQALYQMDLASTDLNEIINEFSVHRLGGNIDDEEYSQADAEFFSTIIKGVVEHQRELDPLVNAHLAEGWRLSRLDSILRAVLRSATFELIYRKDVPAKVVINEYINVAHAFFEGEEPKVVNGVLDKIARQHRGGENDQLANGA